MTALFAPNGTYVDPTLPGPLSGEGIAMYVTHEQMLKTLYEAVACGDVETVMGLLTDDIEFRVYGRSPMMGSYSGKDEVRRFFGKLVEAYGDTFEVHIQDILANDKHGAVLNFRAGPAQRQGLGKSSCSDLRYSWWQMRTNAGF